MKSAILCVDDERVIVMSLMEQLWEHFGGRYVYEMALSGEEALEIIEDLIEEHTSVILIISDWLMNGMNGDELAIRIHERYPHVQTIMLTGQADPVAIENAMNMGALHAFFTKPWERSVLMNKISELIAE